MPSVIRLRQLVRVPYDRHVPLSRRAVFVRDQHECQYCSGPAETLDHVVPRSRGGAAHWDNVVAACRRCNLHKGDRLLEHDPHGAAPPTHDGPPLHLDHHLGGRASRRPGSRTSRPRERSPPSRSSCGGSGLDLRNPLAAGHATIARRRWCWSGSRSADGIEGWGECAALERPTYSSETTDGAWALLRDELVPAVLAGRDAAIVGHPMATAALADARLDAELRASGTSARRRARRDTDLGARRRGCWASARRSTTCWRGSPPHRPA